MNRNEFLDELAEIMMLEDKLTLEMELSSMAQYDSMTQLVILALFEDELNIQISSDDLGDLKTVGDLVSLAGL